MASEVGRSLYKRAIIKLSGEALSGRDDFGINAETLARIAEDCVDAVKTGSELAVVCGGGNFFRGMQGADKGIARARADSIGMLATVMNALAIEAAIEAVGHPARALSAIPMPALCQPYSRQAALHHLDKQRICVIAGGTGNPFFTTDTGAVLRGAELSCDAVLKATQVDGVYSSDPRRDPHAVRLAHLTHDDAIRQNLEVMDTAAFALARENRIPIVVFSIASHHAIRDAICGKGLYTLVSP